MGLPLGRKRDPPLCRDVVVRIGTVRRPLVVPLLVDLAADFFLSLSLLSLPLALADWLRLRFLVVLLLVLERRVCAIRLGAFYLVRSHQGHACR